MRDMLEYQARKEKSKPNKADEKFIAPETTGPITIAAKITCPMSLKISEKTFDFSEEIPIRVYYIIPKKAVNFESCTIQHEPQMIPCSNAK